jgi:hypothetical protein
MTCAWMCVHLRALLPLALVILCRVALGALGDAPTVVQERSFGVGIAFQAACGVAPGVAVVLAARAIRPQLSGARALCFAVALVNTVEALECFAAHAPFWS